MTSLALFIAQALKDELPSTLEEWSEGELHKVIASAIAEHQKATPCKHCGKLEVEHSPGKRCNPSVADGYLSFTPADPTKEKP